MLHCTPSHLYQSYSLPQEAFSNCGDALSPPRSVFVLRERGREVLHYLSGNLPRASLVHS
ncbi:hypothetical protein BAUCODRAFT_245683 [Baudoinia panamericana UAMH 10762]|uniref:Uncharacterized protein n=1 Tax=Baudoinia panamericana (strain UAMH 10762) TaxID=717646 RepID=M2MAS7_BAUPA|nr:uncharacterized protein BAUCODRAFT_245683 [Baudoinia panamericana UAMH 10762]EMC93561.1 hypothetical protein BAUCODRAFT_245683 [Baudoinia panamericana UAMH 10762]